MTRFFACVIVLAVVPMSMLNPMGRQAFLGYYLGVGTMALAFAIAARQPMGTATFFSDARKRWLSPS